MRYILISLGLLMVTSCCVYKDTRTLGDREIKEWGISRYDQRPIAQNDMQV